MFDAHAHESGSCLLRATDAQRVVIIQCAATLCAVRAAEGMNNPVDAAVKEAAQLVLDGSW